MKITLWEVAEIVNAQNDVKIWENQNLTGIEFDARKIIAGGLFVPLKGQRDGHEFLTQAVENGAAATFWSQAQAPNADIPYIQVADPLSAMQKLAEVYLQKKALKVVGITGSNGKTTTKDFTAAVLAGKYVTHKTQGNYNNHIGLPYTILQMPEETEVLVLEMGMDHFGEIEALSKIAHPEIAAITMIGESHLEHLGSRAGIAKAKMEIVAGMNDKGTLVLPAEEPLLTDYQATVAQKVVTFGLDQQGDYFAYDIVSEKEQASFRVNKFPELQFTIPVLGSYNVKNALISLAIGHYFGVEVSVMQKQLAQVQLTQNRTQWVKAANGAEILSDVYNANPTAMGLVLDNFRKLTTTGKKIVVLGDMLELGPDSLALHESMAEFIQPAEIQEVFLYGEKMQALYQVLQKKYASKQLYYFNKEQKADLQKAVANSLGSQDMILLKGSNGMQLGEVVAYLQEYA